MIKSTTILFIAMVSFLFSAASLVAQTKQDPLNSDWKQLPPGRHNIALTMLAGPKAPPEEVWVSVVVPPEKFTGPRPVVLALPPGAGNKDMVDWVLRGYWQNEGTRRGYIIISPEILGHTLDKKASGFVSALFQWMDGHVSYDPNRVALTGTSNGGIGLWHTALAEPDRFAALLGIPAGWQGDGKALAPLAHKPIWLLCGKKDRDWKKMTNKNARALRKAGGNPKVTLLGKQDHVVKIPVTDLYDWLDHSMPVKKRLGQTQTISASAESSQPTWLPQRGLLFRGSFKTDQGSNDGAGLWFPLKRGKAVWLVSAYHLFGPPAGLKAWVPANDLDQAVRSLLLTPVDGKPNLEPKGLEQTLLGVGFGPNEELVDAVMFRTKKSEGLEPLFLATKLPQPKDRVWLLVPDGKGGVHARSGQAEFLHQENRALAFTLDDGDLPARCSGAPLVNDQGEVLGVLVTGGGQLEGRPRFGATVLPTLLLKGMGG